MHKQDAAVWIWTVSALLATAALVAVSTEGPIDLATSSRAWLLVFTTTLAALAAWWGGYVLLYGLLRTASGRSVGWLLCPLVFLSLSFVPTADLLLSSSPTHATVFDEDRYREFRYLAATILGLALLAQETALLAATYGSLRALVTQVARGLGVRVNLTKMAWRLPARPALSVIVLLVVLVAGSVLRLTSLDSYHGGDMDVMLSITYNLLGWPVVAYYHNYVTQTWVYNHLPFFPITLAPFYWLSENVLHFPTVWTAKILIGAADIVIAMVLFRSARGRWQDAWGLALAATWFLSPLVIRGNDHPISFAIAFVLLALVSLDRPWLCGLMLALGVASRNEIAFLALPFLVHFAARRPLAHAVAFFAVSGTVLALITLPFFLFDPAAMDYALRGQLQRDAATVQSMLFTTIVPYLTLGMAAFLRVNPSVPALACAALVALLALRERRVERVVMLVSLIYIVTLPLLYDRYLLFAFAITLYYSARYANPALAVVAFLISWTDFPYGLQVVVALFAAVAFVVIVWPAADTTKRGQRTIVVQEH